MRYPNYEYTIKNKMDAFIRENMPTVGIPIIDTDNARRNCQEMTTGEHRLIDYNSERRLKTAEVYLFVNS